MKVVTKDRTKEGEFDDLPLLAEFVDLVNWQGDRGFHSASLLYIFLMGGDCFLRMRHLQ
jgi:hypothetical protein